MNTIKQELEQDVDTIDDTSGKINPYHKIIVYKWKETIQSYNRWNKGQY